MAMTLHHALLLKAKVPSIIEAYIHLPKENLGEIHTFTPETLGIGEVRLIISRANLRSTGDTGQTIIVAPGTITFEAQQALLKVLEEPPQGTRFVFVVSEQLVILPTLLSRFQLVSDAASARDAVPEFEEFLKLSIALRLELVTKRLAKKDVAFVDTMRQGLMHYLENKPKLSQTELELINFILTTLGTRGASNKMLLEALALALPART